MLFSVMHVRLKTFYNSLLQREYEEFKVKINVLVAKAQKKPEEGWVMQDGNPWPGNNTDNHPAMVQVCQLHYFDVLFYFDSLTNVNT